MTHGEHTVSEHTPYSGAVSSPLRGEVMGKQCSPATPTNSLTTGQGNPLVPYFCPTFQLLTIFMKSGRAKTDLWTMFYCSFLAW